MAKAFFPNPGSEKLPNPTFALTMGVSVFFIKLEFVPAYRPAVNG